MNRRWVWIHRGLMAVLGLLVAMTITVVGAVGYFYWSIRGPEPLDMTPQAARQRVASMVEDTIAHAAPGRTGKLQDPQGHTGSCYRYLAMTDDNSLSFSWEIDEVDGALADQIVARAVGLWSERGFEPQVDNAVDGVTSVYAPKDEDGFSYGLTANRNQRKVWMSGSTPCLKSD